MEIYIDPLAKTAVDHWGAPDQEAKALEEMGELIAALSRRKIVGGERFPIIEEIADVTIMMRQLRLIYGAEEVDRVIDFKMDRLLKRLEAQGALD